MKKLITLLTFMAVGLLTACSSGEGTVLTVGELEATLGEATFVLRELEAVYVEQYGEDIWNQGANGNTFSQVVKEGAIESLTRLYVSKNIAEQNDVALTEDETADIEALISQYLALNSEESLAEDGILVEDVRSIFMLNALGEKLMNEEMVDFVVDEVRLSADLANDMSYQQIEEYGTGGVLEQVTVQHVVISTVKDDGTDYTLEEREVARQTAEEVLEKALAGEDFDDLVAAYSEDPGVADDGGEDTFYRGEMLAEFEEASFDMGVGDILLVESSVGYHIIMKTDHLYPDDEQVQTVENYKTYLVEQYTLSQKQDEYDAFYEAWKGNFEVILNETLWDSVKTSNEL